MYSESVSAFIFANDATSLTLKGTNKHEANPMNSENIETIYVSEIMEIGFTFILFNTLYYSKYFYYLKYNMPLCILVFYYCLLIYIIKSYYLKI